MASDILHKPLSLMFVEYVRPDVQFYSRKFRLEKKCKLFLVVILVVMSRVGDNKNIDALNIYLYITTQKSQLI